MSVEQAERPDRVGIALLAFLVGFLVFPGDLLPAPLETVIGLIVGSAFLGAGSLWSHAVLTDRPDATRHGVIGAVSGGAFGVIVLVADLFLG